MALEAINEIKEAEKKAEKIISEANQDAKEIISNATKEAEIKYGFTCDDIVASYDNAS